LTSGHPFEGGRFFVAHSCELHRLVGMGGVSFLKIQRTPRVPEPTLKDALPLGTVISVREQPDQKYMLIGYATDIKPYAYYAVQWPQGFIDDDSVFLVERYDVSGVVGRGLKDTESQLFMQALDEVMKGAGNDCQGTEKDA
jgi:hypothetical protein